MAARAAPKVSWRVAVLSCDVLVRCAPRNAVQAALCSHSACTVVVVQLGPRVEAASSLGGLICCLTAADGAAAWVTRQRQSRLQKPHVGGAGMLSRPADALHAGLWLAVRRAADWLKQLRTAGAGGACIV